MYFLKKSVLFFLIYFPVLNLCNFYDTSEGWVSDRPDPNRDMWTSSSYYHDVIDSIENENYGLEEEEE